jgi:hypothetical protein
MTLSARTVGWLAERPDAREVVSSVWTTLTALERAGQHPGTLAALRFVLIHHQPPTRTGCCPAPVPLWSSGGRSAASYWDTSPWLARHR